ncbi:MAG: hypothetical protein ACR2OE_04710 [Thermomicrobiales bacterium]
MHAKVSLAVLGMTGERLDIANRLSELNQFNLEMTPNGPSATFKGLKLNSRLFCLEEPIDLGSARTHSPGEFSFRYSLSQSFLFELPCDHLAERSLSNFVEDTFVLKEVIKRRSSMNPTHFSLPPLVDSEQWRVL